MFKYLLLLCCSFALSAKEKPNIILIMADDMGYGELSCTGHKDFKTPHLDKMAKDGALLTDFHSNGAVCSPTRAALMTGRYQNRSGIEGVVTAVGHRHTGLDLKELTMAEALKARGYSTAMFGKWHLGYDPKFNPVHQGFDHFKGFVSGNIDYFSHIDQVGHEDWWIRDKKVKTPGYLTEIITDYGIDFIEQNQEKPFFLYLAHGGPHYPYQGPNDGAYRTPGNPEPIYGAVDDKERAYKDMMASMDAEIGRILKKVKDLKLDTKTLIIFCSDNGGTGKYGSSNAPFRGTKNTFYEGGHRVPALFLWPGKIEANQTITDPVMTMDFMPTLMTLAGEQDIKNLDGVDLSSLLLKNKALAQRNLFWKKGKDFAVREAHWKLMSHKGKLELFDLEKDKAEKNDLSKSNVKQVEHMLKLYRQWEKDVCSGVAPRS
ncbi:sulfatase-like hydrolase/transferase [Lentisphaera profundi]|uniref:Sulfatase-like hydrolase/transferase n=1 Tax=Lentisphaera profundi TaxID=1658616 RepID=A0ABY7VY17_9BACT|nr:sulfatase-like hydrolase/transferase [Lentisphaera profundi]WDE97767.1 sulfatase-like hydrolase/transferase [Lentisphaera profundi]